MYKYFKILILEDLLKCVRNPQIKKKKKTYIQLHKVESFSVLKTNKALLDHR